MHASDIDKYEGPPCQMCQDQRFVGTCTHRPRKRAPRLTAEQIEEALKVDPQAIKDLDRQLNAVFRPRRRDGAVLMTGAHTWKRFTPGEGQTQWDTPKDHWCAFMGGDLGEGGVVTNRGWRVVICCVLCGTVATLPHRIDAKGGVHPSIGCPHKGCALHTIPNTLEGWDHGDRPDTKRH